MSSACPTCGASFVNVEEVDQHVSMVHAEKWQGRGVLSDNGDENSVGSVSPKTTDTIRTQGGRERPSARERARTREQGDGT